MNVWGGNWKGTEQKKKDKKIPERSSANWNHSLQSAWQNRCKAHPAEVAEHTKLMQLFLSRSDRLSHSVNAPTVAAECAPVGGRVFEAVTSPKKTNTSSYTYCSRPFCRTTGQGCGVLEFETTIKLDPRSSMSCKMSYYGSIWKRTWKQRDVGCEWDDALGSSTHAQVLTKSQKLWHDERSVKRACDRDPTVQCCSCSSGFEPHVPPLQKLHWQKLESQKQKDENGENTTGKLKNKSTVQEKWCLLFFFF